MLVSILIPLTLIDYFKASANTEYINYVKTKVFSEAKTYLEKSKEKDSSIECSHMLCVFYRELFEQGGTTDVFHEIPPSNSADS